MPIVSNLIAPVLHKFSNKFGFLVKSNVNDFADEQVKEYGVNTPSINQKVLNLSGGNQQKCMIAMWMGIDPEVIIFDEPTRGVDVGARSEIYQKLRQLAQQEKGIILISSDLPELIGICDRILVFHQGRITGQVDRSEFSEELILSYAAGIRNHSQN